MFQSQKISDHFKAPKKRFEGDGQFTHKIHVSLPLLGADLFVYLTLVNREEEIVTDVFYELSNKIEASGMIDLYFLLLEGRALESLDRITTKEFDHFLRDEAHKGIFEYYDDKFYEILSIGEEILKSIKPKKSKELLFEGTEESFFELSMSSQVEIFEEFFAQTVYKHPKFHISEFDVLDIELYQITISSSTISEELDFYLKTAVQDKLGLKKTEVIILKRKEVQD